MGRKDVIRSIVLQCFLKQANAKLYQCQYCSQQYALNVTRMSNHLLKKCMKCPIEIKIDINQKTRASTSGFSKNTSNSRGNNTTTVKTTTEEFGTDEVDIDSADNSNNSSIPISKITLPEFIPHSPNQSSLATSATNPLSTGSLDSLTEKILPSEEDKLWELLARACYASNTPLNFTENVHWKRVFNEIKPSLKLPSRYQLSNSLLVKEHERIQELVIEKIITAKTIGIQIDGRSNIRNESIINVIITTPDPVLYKVIDTNTNCHDANYLCNLLSSTIDELGLAKVMSITTDNASNMRATWELLNEKYSSGYFSCYGCCAHILNLLIDDIMLKIELFSSITQICKTIVKSIKSSNNLNAAFTHIQNLNKRSTIKSLKLPTQTGWASMFFCLQSLRFNKQNLKQLAIAETVHDVIGADVKHNIFDDSFWQNVDIMYNLLQPIADFIFKMQTSYSCISEVVEVFFNLNLIFNKICPALKLNTIQAFLQKRKQMAVGPVHLAANLLNPKYMGNNLSSDEYIEALTYINKLSPHLISGNNIGEVMTEVALYKAKAHFFAKDFLWAALNSGILSSVVWWKSFCSSTSLSKVAIEILNCPATTCATKKSLSAFGSIHSKKRNKLSNSKTAMLLFVHCNLKLSEPKTLLQDDEPSPESNAFVIEESSEYDSDCSLLPE